MTPDFTIERDYETIYWEDGDIDMVVMVAVKFNTGLPSIVFSVV